MHNLNTFMEISKPCNHLIYILIHFIKFNESSILADFNFIILSMNILNIGDKLLSHSGCPHTRTYKLQKRERGEKETEREREKSNLSCRINQSNANFYYI